MTALLFGMFVISFIAPSVLAWAIAHTATSRPRALMTLVMSEVAAIWLIAVFHWYCFTTYPAWRCGGWISMIYIIFGLIMNGCVFASAYDEIDKKIDGRKIEDA